VSPSVRLDAVGRELLLDLSEGTGRTLRVRLLGALKEAIREGQLSPGTVLPSSRSLAADLGISRGVVVAVFAQLGAEGFLTTRPGAHTVVATAGRRPATAEGAEPHVAGSEPDASGVIDLRPGPPDLAMFPRNAWTAATRDVLRSLEDRELGYAAPWGCWTLRHALGDYLPRVRGATVEPTDVVVVSGVTQGLALLARVLLKLGFDELAVESPSHAEQRRILGGHGLRIIDVPVDDEGVDVGALRRSGARLALVTPAHQYPTGVMLSASRRRALIRWAEEKQGFVLEDDHDAEFRYERLAVGCLQGLAPERVVLLGSVSKSLAPGVRLGWAVAPVPLRAALMSAKAADDFGSAVLGQHVLAKLLTSGMYDAHLRKLRRHYFGRRQVLSAAMAEKLPDWSVATDRAGLHLLLHPPSPLDEARLVEVAQQSGLRVTGLRDMYGSLVGQPGVLLSYARAPNGLLVEAVDRLGDAVATLTKAGVQRSRGKAVTSVAATAADFV